MGARSEEDRRPKCSGKSPAWLPVVEPMPVLKPCYLWALDPRCSTCRLCDLSQVTLPWRFSLASIRWDNTKKTCFTGLWWGKARVVYSVQWAPSTGSGTQVHAHMNPNQEGQGKNPGLLGPAKMTQIVVQLSEEGSLIQRRLFPRA